MTRPPVTRSDADRPGATPSAREELTALVERILGEQQRLVVDRFDNDDALRLGLLLVRMARERSLAVTVDIRRHGHQLFHVSLPGTVPDNDTWVLRKSRVVDRFGVPSYLAGLRPRLTGRTFTEVHHLDPQEYAAHGGSFPITVRDVGIVGTVTVSGLPQAEDHALVVDALTAFLEGDGG
jgi:uncharacterized protein (UPF0303 family)